MSGIAGIFNRDGRPIDPTQLTGLLDLIQHRGPDGTGQWIHGPVGLGHQMLQTTPESLSERQPLVDESVQVCLTLDGRVDNRVELQHALDLAGASLRDDTDAELVLKSYLVWGEDCPVRIIGDFAFAIWDERVQKLFCARDYIGIKPFYYYVDREKFIFGSELRQVLDYPGIPVAMNEGMVGEFLADRITSLEETIYEGIMRLPPAHSMIINSEQVKKQRYWSLEPSQEIRYQNDQEYADHFFDIFKEAVRCRMRSHRPVGAYLSGGLDSSSVVCMAEWLIHSGLEAPIGFETYSLLFPYLTCDESEFIKEVVRMWGCKSNQIEGGGDEDAEIEGQSLCYKDIVDPPNLRAFDPIRKLASEKQCRVILSGEGGDQCLSGNLYYYSDLLSKGHLRTLVATAKVERVKFKQVIHSGLSSLILEASPFYIKKIAHVKRQWPWLQDKFVSRTNLVERVERTPWRISNQTYHVRGMVDQLFDGFETWAHETVERNESRFQLEGRHPFFDQRIIKYLLSIPANQIYRGNYQKVVLRNSMKNLLPPRITRRLTKPVLNHLFVNAFHFYTFFYDLTVEDTISKNIIDSQWISNEYERMSLYSGTGNPTQYIWALWFIFCVKNCYRKTIAPTECGKVRTR